jgi:clathrin heavy chain
MHAAWSVNPASAGYPVLPLFGIAVDEFRHCVQVCEYYMTRGYFTELITLLYSGIGLERAHMGIFTALGEMYANHEPDKLMEHLKLWGTRVNIPRLISICDRQMLWKELTYLFEKYDEFDNALDTMMAHDAVAWEHVRFKDVAVKCSTVDIFYKAIQHYFDMHPDVVTDLLKVLEGRIDHSRVVALVRSGGHLGLAKDYLIAVQKNNLPSVNEAMNELLIEEDDYEALEASVESYDNFDQLKLAEDLEVHLPSPPFCTCCWPLLRQTVLA